jgi:hypothetical protein
LMGVERGGKLTQLRGPRRTSPKLPPGLVSQAGWSIAELEECVCSALKDWDPERPSERGSPFFLFNRSAWGQGKKIIVIVTNGRRSPILASKDLPPIQHQHLFPPSCRRTLNSYFQPRHPARNPCPNPEELPSVWVLDKRDSEENRPFLFLFLVFPVSYYSTARSERE